MAKSKYGTHWHLNIAIIWFFVALVLLLAPLTARGASGIEDTEITRHIESEMLFDPAVPFNSINIHTGNGIVTLSGTVTNILAKEHATRIAETVRGVRSVINQIEVDPVVDKPAKTLADQVNNALYYDAATDSYEINIIADDDGKITLTGDLDSWQERTLAETTAKSVSGVSAIENKIEIRERASPRPDTEIKPEIKERLRWDTLVDHGLIDVRVDDGQVFLSGVVGSAAEKRRAQWDAWVEGVQSVNSNGLNVKKWARDDDLRKGKYTKKSDKEIIQAVEEALLYDPRVNSFALSVSSKNGTVTLQGVVDNIQAKKAALHDARNTVGVVDIYNHIMVRPTHDDIDDDEIADSIQDALARDPYTEAYEIDVKVNNNKVRLYGLVDTYFEKAQAENVAYRTDGVTNVVNNLAVSEPAAITEKPYVTDWSIYDYPWYDRPAIVQHKSDWQIAEAIREELVWSPFVDRDEVNVDVEDGVATLTGTVDSWSEFEAARENSFEAGALTVINRLKVEK